MRYNISDFLMM